MDKRLVTLGKSASAELVEKKSVFIGYASPVSDEAEALDFVAKIKKKHADARHKMQSISRRAQGEGKLRGRCIFCKARRQAKVEGGTFPVAESSKVPSMSKKMARKDMVPPKEKAFVRKAF